MGAMSVAGLSTGAAAIGSATADDEASVWGVAYHGSEKQSTISSPQVVFDGPSSEIIYNVGDYYNITLDPGEYLVAPNAQGYDHNSQTITLESGESRELNFVFEPKFSGTLEGNVVDESGDSVEGSQGSIQLDGEYASLSISPDSEFEIDLQEGEWDIEPDILGYDAEAETVSITEDEATEAEFEVTSNGKALLYILLDFDGDDTETEVMISGPTNRDITLDEGEDEVVEKVEAGEYNIAVDPDGYNSEVDIGVEVEHASENFVQYELEEL